MSTRKQEGRDRIVRAGWLARAGAVALTLLAPALAPGQVLVFPEEARTRADLSEADRQKVRDYIKAGSANLRSDQAALVRTDRNLLIEPLMKPDTSAAVRLVYRDELAAKLREMAGTSDEFAQINAMIIAGEIGTFETTRVLLTGLDAKLATVRYQASYGLRRTFESLAAGPQGIAPEEAQSLVPDIQRKLTAEAAEHVVDGLARALLAGAGVGASGYQRFAGACVSGACKGLGERADLKGSAALGPAMTDALADTCNRIREQLLSRAAHLTNQPLIDAAEFAGKVLSHAARVAGSRGGLPAAPARARYTAATASAESLVPLIGRALDANFAAAVPQASQHLKAATTAEDAKFADEVARIAGPGGILAAAPFNIPTDRFRGN